MRTIPEKKKKWFGQGFYLYCWDSYINGIEEVQGQISQGKPSFDLLLFILLVVLIAPLYTWFLVSCVIFGPLLYAYLFPKYVEPLVDALHTCSQVCEPPC